MAVPGHDARDHEFAKVFGLPITRVVSNDDKDDNLPYTGYHYFLSGLQTTKPSKFNSMARAAPLCFSFLVFGGKAPSQEGSGKTHQSFISNASAKVWESVTSECPWGVTILV